MVVLSLNARWPATTSVPTMQLNFLVVNAVALAVLGPPPHVPPGVIAAAVAGAVAGWYLSAPLSASHLRNATLVSASIGSVLAIARGFTLLG